MAKAAIYHWQGSNALGEIQKGDLEAPSLMLAKAQLRRQGIQLASIQKKSKSLFQKTQNQSIKPSEIAMILEQLATLIQAGIPIVQSLNLIAEIESNPQAKQVLLAIKTDIANGTSFSQALKHYSQYFNPLICHLLAAGEQSGTLDSMLKRIADYTQKTEQLKKKVRKALIYPATILVVALVITLGLLVFIVPTFQEVFDSFNAPLPLATRVVIHISTMLRQYGGFILGSLMVGIYTLKRFYRPKAALSMKIDGLFIKLPILGNILSKAAIARFAHTLATTLGAGLPVLKALDNVAQATGNRVFNAAVSKIRDEIAKGQKIQAAMRYTKVFPPLVVQMVAMGENAGSLESMLSKIADLYERDVSHAVDNLTTLLEPILMVILGGLVGGLVIALYLPVFKLGAVVH